MKTRKEKERPTDKEARESGERANGIKIGIPSLPPPFAAADGETASIAFTTVFSLCKVCRLLLMTISEREHQMPDRFNHSTRENKCRIRKGRGRNNYELTPLTSHYSLLTKDREKRKRKGTKDKRHPSPAVI